MQTQNQIFSASLMNSQFEKSIWNKISSEESLTARFLRQNKNKLNWKAVSENHNISWNAGMLKEFSERLSWKRITETIFDHWYDSGIDTKKMRIEELMTFIEEFDEQWNWDMLSLEVSHPHIEDVLDKYADKLNWGNVVENRRIEWTPQMATKYEKYIIGVSDIKDSCMWRSLSENVASQLKQTLMNE